MASAIDDLGPHLLGRIESESDERDFQLGAFMTGDPLDAALAALMLHKYSSWFKTWATVITARVQAGSPAPQPVPSPTLHGWLDDDDPVLDQGQTGHCVGFTGADWENALPVDDHVLNNMGDDIYYACKIIDGEPKQENGSSVRSLMKVLKARGRLKAYAAAGSIQDVINFVTTSGPICWGIGWTQSMFTPDSRGLIIPSGPDVGGHAIIEYDYDASTDEHLLLNHWGPSWAIKGRFRMRGVDLAERLANGGEAWAAVELPA